MKRPVLDALHCHLTADELNARHLQEHQALRASVLLNGFAVIVLALAVVVHHFAPRRGNAPRSTLSAAPGPTGPTATTPPK